MAGLKHVFDVTRQAMELFDKGKIDDAKAKTLLAESHQTAFTDPKEKAQCRQIVAGCLVDIGFAANDKDMVARGTQYFQEWVDQYGVPDDVEMNYYNLANGYSDLWKFHSADHLKNGVDADEHKRARHYYYQATQHIRLREFACQLWTNYGNILDSIGRHVEAIDAYDHALRINPSMAMALGNKALALSYLAPTMRGYTHLFYLEAIRLLEQALHQPLYPDAKTEFQREREKLNYVLEKHGHELTPEKVQGIEPITDFHRFLCEFCAEHTLFLSPVTFLGAEGKAFYGDPMFISSIHVKLDEQGRFERYATFLNEIKQDYILGRYFLVQSQYASAEIDAVDEGVTLIYPLDYSLNSSYIQLLKAARKQAIDVLDKVAFFIYDYSGIQRKGLSFDTVSFLKLFEEKGSLTDFGDFYNWSLFALMTLAHDCSKNGDWNIFYQHRHALTHRFLILHDIAVPPSTNDLPRVWEPDFLNQTTLAFQVAKAAVMYLILFVERHENKRRSQSTGLSMPMNATPVEGVFRHRPQYPLTRNHD